MEKKQIIQSAHHMMINEGYSCAQAIVYGMLKMINEYQEIDDEKFSEYINIASAFGGGIGGLRQTCGFIAGSGVAYSLIIKDNDILRAKVSMVSEMVENLGGHWQCEKIIEQYNDQSKEARKEECVKMLDKILESVLEDIKNVFN